MTLTEFLLARIAEDEERARAAIADDMGSDEGFAGQYDILRRPPSGVGIASGGFGDAAARMIATYAVPARVLAECEVKRRIVEEHSPHIHPVYGPLCTTCASGDENGAEWPCPTVRALATVYAGHEDFQEDWRP